MIDRLGLHGPHDAELVGNGRRVRQEFAEPLTAFPMLLELEHRRRDRKPLLPRGHRGNALAHSDTVRNVLIKVGLHLRLGIEEIHLRRTATLEKKDDALRLRDKMRNVTHSRQPAAIRGETGVPQHRRQGCGSQSCGTLEEKLAAPEIEARENPVAGCREVRIGGGHHGVAGLTRA